MKNTAEQTRQHNLKPSNKNYCKTYRKILQTRNKQVTLLKGRNRRNYATLSLAKNQNNHKLKYPNEEKGTPKQNKILKRNTSNKINLPKPNHDTQASYKFLPNRHTKHFDTSSHHKKPFSITKIITRSNHQRCSIKTTISLYSEESTGVGVSF